MATKITPFRIKTVEKIRLIPRETRVKLIEDAGYNLFFINSEDVYVDVLTDSGTGAQSMEQRSAAELGDESYAGSKSFRRLRAAIQNILGFPLTIPVHQGRGAEKVFNGALVEQGFVVPGNAHFDTTRAHIKMCGGNPLNCTIDEAYNPDLNHPFKGNINLHKLESALKTYKKHVPYILLTITCNTVGGQPVSLKNIRETSLLAKEYGVPLFFDGARFAENAFFIKQRELGLNKVSISEIVLEMMKVSDGILMSAKKDAIVNMGGFIALRDPKLYERLTPGAVACEGFLHYGGMSGRNMEELAAGLSDGIDEDNLAQKIGQVEYLGNCLHKLGVPVIRPFGGHGVYVDAGRLLPHIKWSEFPGQSLAVALYVEGGIRSVEVGSLMEGGKAPIELLRLAIPWRVYLKEHMDHIADTFKIILKQKKHLRGYGFVSETKLLRHFTSKLKPL